MCLCHIMLAIVTFFCLASVQYCSIFTLPFSLFVPLWQAGKKQAVVYPGKLPIVSGGNSLWERAPRERGSAERKKLTTDLLEQHWQGFVPPLGSGARGKRAVPWDWDR